MKSRFHSRGLVAAICLLAILAVAAAPASVSKFRDILIENSLVVKGLSATAGLTNVGTLTQMGDESVTGNETVSGFQLYGAGTLISVTTSVPITATASYQPIASAAAVSTTLAVLSAGTRVCFTNTLTPTVAISDTGTTVLTGTLQLGRYDTLCVMSDGTNMLELSFTDN